MANPYRGQVELNIAGEDDTVTRYQLHYDGNALVGIEESMDGMPIGVMLREHVELLDGFRFRRAALYHGLQNDPRGRKLTLKDCGKLVSSAQAKDINFAVLRGVFLALGQDISKAMAEQEAAEKAQDAEAAEKVAGVVDSKDPLGPVV